VQPVHPGDDSPGGLHPVADDRAPPTALACIHDH